MTRWVRPWVDRLARFRALDDSSRRLLIRAQLELVRAWWRVQRRPIGKLVQVTAAAGAGEVNGDAVALARAVGRAARHGVFRPACLIRALALHQMLEERGHHGGVVRVGVKKEGGVFTAHAWVELGGVALGEDPAEVKRYVRLTDARLTAVQ